MLADGTDLISRSWLAHVAALTSRVGYSEHVTV